MLNPKICTQVVLGQVAFICPDTPIRKFGAGPCLTPGFLAIDCSLEYF